MFRYPAYRVRNGHDNAGTAVIQEYFNFPILISMIVPMINGAGGKELITHTEERPNCRYVSGIHEITPGTREKETGNNDPGIQRFSANLGMILPTISWRKNLPTRVPVSTAVNINTASNMMAKWYQYDINPFIKELTKDICQCPRREKPHRPAVLECFPEPVRQDLEDSREPYPAFGKLPELS